MFRKVRLRIGLDISNLVRYNMVDNSQCTLTNKYGSPTNLISYESTNLVRMRGK